MSSSSAPAFAHFAQRVLDGEVRVLLVPITAARDTHVADELAKNARTRSGTTVAVIHDMRRNTRTVRSETRNQNAKARRRKRAAKRSETIRAVAKPEGREAQIQWAENLGYAALNEVRGGGLGSICKAIFQRPPEQVYGCCSWQAGTRIK